VAVVESFKTDTVIFLPDEYLAKNVANETGKHIVFPTPGARNFEDSGLDYQMIGLARALRVHEKFTVADIETGAGAVPGCGGADAPGMQPGVVAASDFSGSTNAMIRYVQQTKAPRYWC